MENARSIETGFGALLTPEEEGKKNELITKLSKINIKTIKNDNETIKKRKDKGNENPIQKEDFNRDNEDWSPNAISFLLNAWSHHDKNSNESSKLDMDLVWKEISQEVSSRCKNSKKPKDLEQCKSKLKSMKGRYNREKMAKKFNPNESNSWEWYNTMNSLFIGNTQLVANSMDIKSTKQRISLNNDVLNSRILCDINDNNTGKSPLVDVNEEGGFDLKFYEDEKIVQHSNLSTPTIPKSPKTFIKVKWNNSIPLQLDIMDNFKQDQICQDNLLNVEPFESQSGKKSFQKVNKVTKTPLNCKQGNPNNVSTIDRKDKGTLLNFDLHYDNSSNCFESDTIDQGNTTLSPLVLKSFQSKLMSNKCEDSSSSDKDGEDQDINRMNTMELFESINCNNKHACIENTTNVKCKNENKEVLRETISKIDEPKSHAISKARAQNQILATGIVRNDEQMAMSMANADLKAHSTKMFSKGGSLASLTLQSEISFPTKQKRRLRVSSKYKYNHRNQLSRTLITTLMRAIHNTLQFRKKVKPRNQAFFAHEPNMVIALMTFGAMIQQLEKNHIGSIEKILNEQSNIIKDFVKTLKNNHQIREATMVGLVVRFLLSIFLVGVILFGTSKTRSNWMPMDFQSSSWYGKNIDDNVSQLAWVGCFIIVLFTQLLWTSFKKKPILPSHF